MDGDVDPATVESFGDEWATYDQSRRDPDELRGTFDRYFSEFPWDLLAPSSRGIDLGCGSGRWARLVAARVGVLVAVDPSERALGAARDLLGATPNVHLVRGAGGALPVADASMDFGYALGVLHHTPDPVAALRDCVRCLRPGAPLLVYVYYALDGRPRWFRGLWRLSDRLRLRLSRTRPATRHRVATTIAGAVYLPLARSARVLRRAGLRHLPLEAYSDKPFSVMRTDAYDRFATPLEHRFSRTELEAMLREAGLTDLRFREDAPYWCVVGRRV